jgi:hypothetical protein
MTAGERTPHGQADTRRDWATPKFTRLASSHAEFNPIFTTDAEGTS